MPLKTDVSEEKMFENNIQFSCEYNRNDTVFQIKDNQNKFDDKFDDKHKETESKNNVRSRTLKMKIKRNLS